VLIIQRVTTRANAGFTPGFLRELEVATKVWWRVIHVGFGVEWRRV